jgi:hypothetical protein
MSVWILVLSLNGYKIQHKYSFLFKENCEKVGKTFLNKRNTNKYNCVPKKIKNE